LNEPHGWTASIFSQTRPPTARPRASDSIRGVSMYSPSAAMGVCSEGRFFRGGKLSSLPSPAAKNVRGHQGGRTVGHGPSSLQQFRPVDRRLGQVLLDAQELVVLGDAVGAAQ